MASIPNVGTTVTPRPSDNNQRTASESQRTTFSSPGIDAAVEPKFVDRRRNRDRRRHAKSPLLDTRRNRDRRRTGRLHIEI